MSDNTETADWVEAARGGDDTAFGRLVDRFRAELVLHAYRMLGRYDDAEDAVQDALLQAWRGIADFEGRAGIRSWLYRITTNTCLSRRTTAERRRQILAATTVIDDVAAPVAATVPWLQALPDEIVGAVAARGEDHADRLISRESIEITFVAALQHLPDRQRAVLLLRDIAGWSARETAEQLDTTVSAANAALHRARSTVRTVLGPDRERWPSVEPDPDRGDLLRRYVAAVEAADDAAIADLLTEDVLVSHQPYAGQGTAEVGWYRGRDAVIAAWAPALHGSMALDLRLRPVWVNREPAVASYGRLPGTDVHRAFGLAVLRVADGRVAEVINLATDQFPALDLPTQLTSDQL